MLSQVSYPTPGCAKSRGRNSSPEIFEIFEKSKTLNKLPIDISGGEPFLKEDIIEKAEKVGKTQLYQLNNKNQKAKIVLILERFIVAERLEKLVKKEPIGVVSEFAGIPEAIKSVTILTPETAINVSGYTSAPGGICATSQSDEKNTHEDWRISYG